MEASNTNQPKIWSKITRLATFLGLIASIAAIASLIYQIKTERRSLEIQVTTADQLTSLPNVEGLKGTFFYKDANVIDLWKLRIKFINNGNVTLIGQGQLSHLLQSNIPIRFPNNIVIVDISKTSSDFYTITQTSPNQIELSFSQWRPKEEFEITLYITSDTTLNSPPIPTIIDRPIIDGDVFISESMQGTPENKPLLDRLPIPITSAVRVLGIILIVINFGLIFYVSIIALPKDYINTSRWKTVNSLRFAEYLTEANIETTVKEGIIKRPWTLNKEYVKDLSIRNPALATKINNLNVPGAPGLETFWSMVLSLLTGILLCGVCVGIIAGLIIM